MVRTILGKAKHGTIIIYIPENHDELLRPYDQIILGNLEIYNKYIYKTNDGKRFLILHGDEFDCIVMNSTTLALISSALYEIQLNANTVVNFFRS